MADQWEPIRIYSYLGATKPDISVTRERVVSYLNGTDPDRIEAAGKSYVEAAKLIKGEGGVQGALMKAAKDLSEVWRGPSARQAMKALRLLHASAGALGDAMQKTGEPMKKYAERVRHYRSTVPAPAVAPGLVNRGVTGGQSGGGIGTDGTAPPLITGSGLNGGSYTPLAPLADEQARRHLENLNIEIVDINLQIAEGLAFQLPEITPLTVDTQPAKKLHVPGVTDTSGSGGDGRWTGGSGSEGSYGTGGSGHTGGSGNGGTGSGGTGDGSNGTGTGSDGSGGTGDGTTKPQDPGQQGQDDPSNGGDPTTQQPGTGDQQQQQPGQDQQQQPGQEEAPAVIGGPDNQRTELAQTPTATQPPPTTTTPNPYTSTPNPYVSTPPTIFPNTQPPGSTPYGGTGVGPWYGGGGAPATSPSVLRSTPGNGNGFMAFPPGAMGAGGQNNSDEHTREYYDSEADIWSPPVETSPDKLG
ncbi:hypothetical protein WBK31_30400 [Nonomuraea sp. N2-4H]|jgi:hypothetical protein|uniref:hypothetical protein n=1 Tax=Nonomuraea sp. N2-4H TaxID=3128898 RepID=UPI0032516F4A